MQAPVWPELGHPNVFSLYGVPESLLVLRVGEDCVGDRCVRESGRAEPLCPGERQLTVLREGLSPRWQARIVKVPEDADAWSNREPHSMNVMAGLANDVPPSI